MASELQWVHQYCLTCDQQTDGATYCSESCRLADYEEATQFSPPTSGPGSPSWAPTGISTYPWSMGAPSARSRQLFTLTPNYDFQSQQSQSASTSKPQPTSSLSLPPTTATTTVTYHHVLSPSSSQTSLSSMRSSTSSTSGALGALSAFAHGSASQSLSSSSSTAATSTSSDLSQRVRSELRKYASSLEQGRHQRQPQRRTSC